MLVKQVYIVIRLGHQSFIVVLQGYILVWQGYIVVQQGYIVAEVKC